MAAETTEVVEEVVEQDEVVTDVVEEVVEEELSLDEKLNNINTTLEEQLKESEQRALELEQKMDKINLTASLTSEKLEIFDGLFDLTSNDDKVAFLKNAVNQILVANSYQPKETAKQEAYDTAINNGDVKSAINFKLSRLFGK